MLTSNDKQLFHIEWSRNHVVTEGRGMQAGFDKAWGYSEACDIAKTRVDRGGIPSNATVFIMRAQDGAAGRPVRVYSKDYDGRISHEDFPL
jgi:hypothetical protein